MVTVLRDDILIPPETAFADPLQTLQIILAAIDINKTVALSVSLVSAYHINCCPWAVAHQLDAVSNCQTHLLNVRLKESDTVIVIHRPIMLQLIRCAHTVFADQNRQAVALAHFTQRQAQSHRINDPAVRRFADPRIFNPTLAIVGDLSALYDLNALALLRQVSAPLVLIVVNNNGGQIFSLLPTPKSERERFYLMPQNVHFEHAAAMFELKYHRPQNWQELETTLVDAWRTPTTTVIEMVVNDTDGAQTLQQLLAQVSHL